MDMKQTVRRAFVASGQVQGVGFRPFVYRLAREGGLTGTVGNTSDGVRMEVQGPPAEVERFFTELGVELKVERGNRVFPASDRAADIIDALFYELKRLKVPILQTRVTALCIADGAVTGLETEQGPLEAGQLFWPQAGSPIRPPVPPETATVWQPRRGTRCGA